MVAKTETKKASYPVFPEKNWWILRKRFNQRVPTVVDASYLADVFKIEDASARNWIYPLKRMGLIDEDGKPTERSYRWRDNEQYPGVCEELLQELYPSQLLDAFSDPSSISRASLENRFKSDARVGESAATQMAAFYTLLLEADPTKQDTAINNSTKQPTRANKAQSPGSKGSASAAKQVVRGGSVKANGHLAEAEEVKPHQARHTRDSGPSVHFNIQVHISPDASADQIDHTFASMAKHFAPFFRQDHE